MALNNCTINSVTLTKIGGSAIGSQNAQLVITPDQGYVVSASSFTNNTGATSGITSISLSNSGTAGTIGNTVLVDVDLNDSYTMPSANTDIVIDIDGNASLVQYTIQGTYDVTSFTNPSNVSPSPSTNTAYSSSGAYDTSTQIFTKVISANSGYYFASAPEAVLSIGDQNSYTITYDSTNDSDGNLISRTFYISYKFPNESVSGDKIIFKASAIAIPVIQTEITGYNISSSNILEIGENRIYKVFGGAGAEFSVTVVDSGGTSVSSISNITMPSSGSYSYVIPFPTISSGSETYTICITGDLSNTFNTSSGQPSCLDILQKSKVKLTLSVTTTESGITLPSNLDTYLEVNETDFGIYDENTTTFVLTSSSNIGLDNIPISAFTNQNSSSLNYEVTQINIYNNNSTSVTIKLSFNIYSTTEQDLTSVLNIDNYIQNTAPVANTVSVSAQKGGGTLVTLNATDANNDTLTYTIVSVPSNGSLFTDANQTTSVSAGSSLSGSTVYYKHDDSTNFIDSFTYKANDGSEDSNTATVNAAIGVSPGASITTSGQEGVYLVPVVLGTGAGVFKVHFNAISVPDRFEILFSNNDNSNGNQLSYMSVQADSLFVGDNISSTNPARQQHGPSGMDLFTYNGSSFDTTSEDSQAVTITDNDVATTTGNRSDNVPNGGSFGSSGNQSGVQNLVYTSTGDNSGTSNLGYSDGNICLKFTKQATTNTYLAYLRITGISSSTSWNVYKTEFSNQQ
jgi:hypothetical protein